MEVNGEHEETFVYDRVIRISLRESLASSNMDVTTNIAQVWTVAYILCNKKIKTASKTRILTQLSQKL